MLFRSPAEDFTLRILYQTVSQMDSSGEPNWFGQSSFGTTPVPDGTFTSWYNQTAIARYTGTPEDREKYQSIGASYRPMEGDEERPDPDQPGGNFGGGSDSNGSSWGQNELDWDWEDEVFLIGGGSSYGGIVDPPTAFAADLYLNGEKVAELTLYPVKGGLDLD